MRFLLAIFTLFFLFSPISFSQKLTNADYPLYIQKYKNLAIREMQMFRIPASITLAQGLLESGCGKSELALATNNHFGIKCQKEWTGDTYYYDDDAPNECFRKYKTVDESFRDHSLFLTTRSRYASLFTLEVTDYKGWAKGLKQAGYATNPEYANILIKLIETHKLFQYDEVGPKPKENLIVEKKDVLPLKVEVKNEGKVLYRSDYQFPSKANFEVAYVSDMGRKVYENEGVPFIFANKDDTWHTIAKEFGIYSFQIYKQNDLLETDEVLPGQMLYLEPKNKKNHQKTYVVKKGDSMYSISQDKCIRLPLLLRYNNLKPGDEPTPGFMVKLTR